MAFWVLAVLFVLLLVMIVSIQWSKHKKSIPGPQLVNQRDGNLPDVSKAGSLHEYLLDLHQTYGSIAGFWWGPMYAVSIGSAELFKDHTRAYDRAEEFFTLFKPLLGENGVVYMKGSEAKRRLSPYGKCLRGAQLKQFFPLFQELSDELIRKWSSLPSEEHIALQHNCFNYTMKALLRGTLGGEYREESEISDIIEANEVVWNEMEEWLISGIPAVNSTRMNIFDQQKKILYDCMYKAVHSRRNNPPEAGEHQMIDAIMALDLPDSVSVQDLVAMFFGGFNTSGLLLTWALYFIASHPEVQAKLYKELKEVLGEDAIGPENIKNLTYLDQVVKETLRRCVLAPFSVRIQYSDIQIRGHTIPARTPVISALGVSLSDPEVFPDPKRFDPERFSPQNAKNVPKFGCAPFGFDKRMCPGTDLAKIEAPFFLAEVIRNFEIVLVEGQVVTQSFGLVTKPKQEIWVTITKRV